VTQEATETEKPGAFRSYVGHAERTADPQCRVQLPDDWIHDTPQRFIAKLGVIHPGVVSLFPPEAAQFMVPALTSETFDPTHLLKMTKVGKDIHHVTVDSNNRLPLSEAKFRSLLTPEGKSAPVKLFGSVHFFSICPLGVWPEVEQHLLNST